MDLWQKWMGVTQPTLVSLEGGQWVDIPLTSAGVREMDRRAAKEGWEDDLTAPQAGAGSDVDAGAHAFHLLATWRGDSGADRDRLEISSRGVPLTTLAGADVEAALTQMHDAGETVVAAPARARRRADGTWLVEVRV